MNRSSRDIAKLSATSAALFGLQMSPFVKLVVASQIGVSFEDDWYESGENRGKAVGGFGAHGFTAYYDRTNGSCQALVPARSAPDKRIRRLSRFILRPGAVYERSQEVIFAQHRKCRGRATKMCGLARSSVTIT